MKYYFLALKRFSDFNSRSSFKEYWYFVFFNLIFSLIFFLIDQILGTQIILNLSFLILMTIPHIAVAIRRLHDVGKKGLMLLFLLVYQTYYLNCSINCFTNSAFPLRVASHISPEVFTDSLQQSFAKSLTHLIISLIIIFLSSIESMHHNRLLHKPLF